jgi:hypothetical protein
MAKCSVCGKILRIKGAEEGDSVFCWGNADEHILSEDAVVGEFKNVRGKMICSVCKKKIPFAEKDDEGESVICFKEGNLHPSEVYGDVEEGEVV